METLNKNAKEVQGTKVATKEEVKELSNKLLEILKLIAEDELEAVTVRLSGRKLLIPLSMTEEFVNNEKLWERFKTIVEKTKETAPAVTVMYTVAKMEV